MKTFKKDKWYYYRHPEGIYYLKSKDNSQGRIYYSEYIWVKGHRHYYSERHYDNEHVTDEEVPMEEIKNYLPKDHPDLLKTDTIIYEIY